MSSTNIYELPPAEIAVLAPAIAFRTLIAEQLTAQVRARLDGLEPALEDPDAFRLKLRERTAYYLGRISSRQQATLAESVERGMGDEKFELMAQELSDETGQTVAADEVRAFSKDMADAVSNATDDEKEGQTSLEATFIAACKVAAENNVEVPAVYYNTELFDSVLRMMKTPEEFATGMANNTNALTADVLMNALVRHYGIFYSQENADLTQEESALAFQLDDEIRAHFEAIAEHSREQSRQSAYYLIRRIYGPTAFEELPLEVQLVITPRLPLVEIKE